MTFVCAREKLRGFKGRVSCFIPHVRIEFSRQPSLLGLISKFTVLYPRGCSKIVFKNTVMINQVPGIQVTGTQDNREI